MDLKILLLLILIAFAQAAADDFEPETEDEEDNQLDIEGQQVDNGYRKPLDFQIRVPFFQMFLRRQKDGPSKLGLQVFPSENGSLVNINHRWWGKK